MKKNIMYFVVFFLLLLTGYPVFCADNISVRLAEIEKSYYGFTYSDSPESRLARLEKSVYGSTSKKPQKTRVEKLYKDLNLDAAAKTPAASNAPSKDIGPKADANIKYPVVDEMEKMVFKKAYENEDIYARLSRLEKQTFKKESTLSLNERVDALRSRILRGKENKADTVEIDPVREEIVLENGQKYFGDEGKASGFNINEPDENSHYNYYSYENSKNRIPDPYTQNNIYDEGDYAEQYAQNYDLDMLEKTVFGKRYSDELPSKRLARLESKVFDRTFSDGEDSRIQRLLAVTTAQKTSQEYDSNKWARRLNAGMQIGSILLMVLAMIL